MRLAYLAVFTGGAAMLSGCYEIDNKVIQNIEKSADSCPFEVDTLYRVELYNEKGEARDGGRLRFSYVDDWSQACTLTHARNLDKAIGTRLSSLDIRRKVYVDRGISVLFEASSSPVEYRNGWIITRYTDRIVEVRVDCGVSKNADTAAEASRIKLGVSWSNCRINSKKQLVEIATNPIFKPQAILTPVDTDIQGKVN